jgi:hypothetical protein
VSQQGPRQSARPSPGDLRRGNGYLAPQRGSSKIRRWQPYQNPAGTLCGFADIELPSGMIINGCKLMVGPRGKYWIALPAIKQLDAHGNPLLDANNKPRWAAVVEFRDRAAANRFRDLVLEALRRQHPTAFDGAERP